MEAWIEIISNNLAYLNVMTSNRTYQSSAHLRIVFLRTRNSQNANLIDSFEFNAFSEKYIRFSCIL